MEKEGNNSDNIDGLIVGLLKLLIMLKIFHDERTGVSGQSWDSFVKRMTE